jgi:superfamily I DNA/RNA helicase/mRNA-degrading endonuclease RelE of RelBE toxin-antitoxin system
VADLLLSDNFAKDLKKIDGSVRKKIVDFQLKLIQDPDGSGLDLKIPQGKSSKRVRTARVDKFWRAVLIALPSKDAYLLWTVMAHDDAYEFAEKLNVSVNGVNGALEVVESGRDMAIQHEPAGAGTAGETAEPSPAVPLLRLSPEELVELGVPGDTAATALQFTAEDELLEFAADLPGVQGEILMDLAAGLSLAETLQRYVVSDVDVDDIDAALDRYGLTLADDSDEQGDVWEGILDGDFQAWRVWLHPQQRQVAYHDGFDGPVRVTGAAGTGKTVTALHRARHLAARNSLEVGQGVSIFLATYTRNLATALQEQLIDLTGVRGAQRVDIRTIDSIALGIVRSIPANQDLRVTGRESAEITQLWEAVVTETGSTRSAKQLAREWSNIVLAHGCASFEEYKEAHRVMGTDKPSAELESDWRAIELFLTKLDSARLTTFLQASATATELISSGQYDSPYRHGIVDEAQDLHPAHWRLVRALVPPGPDDLFIAGDAHQRIYGDPVNLANYGIDTTGRHERLTVNYRTSREILDWSLSVLGGAEVDDLSGGAEGTHGARSIFTGPEPRLVPCKDSDEEMQGLVNALRRWSDHGVQWHEMAVFARKSSLLGKVMRALDDAGIPALQVDSAEKSLAETANRVHCMTMHRAKGLEFKAVALVRMGSRHADMAYLESLDGQELQQARDTERNLLYVAGSRAREELAVLWTGEPAEVLRRGE